MQCGSMDLLMGRPSSTMSMLVRDMTLGAYLPRNYSMKTLRVFRSCGDGECRIINSNIFCRGVPQWNQLRLSLNLIPIMMSIDVLSFYIIGKGTFEGTRLARSQCG